MKFLRLSAAAITVVLSASVLVASPAAADGKPEAAVQTANTRPDTPAPEDVRDSHGGTCSTDPAAPRLINTTTPTLYAKVRDQDRTGQSGGVKLKAEFEWEADETPLGSAESTAADAPVWPAAAEHSIKASGLPELTPVRYRARAHDETEPGDWSQWCHLEVKTTKPAASPTVTSSDYPDDNGFHGRIGLPGDFTFSGDGDPDAVHFYYDLMGGSCTTKTTPDIPGGEVTVSITPSRDGPQTLYARTVDAYGNSSVCQAVYTFRVKPLSEPVAHFPLDEGNGGSAADASDAGRTATGSVAWTRGRVGAVENPNTNPSTRLENAAVKTDGASQRLSTTGPVVDTAESFSVSAWVLLEDKKRDRVAVSQNGAARSGFSLGYRHGSGHWVFEMADADVSGSGWQRARSDAKADKGAWTHLLGRFDAETGAMTLYVNGVEQERTGVQATPWNAGGAFVIGGAERNGNASAAWAGAIDDVKVWDRPLYDEPIPTGLPVAETWTLANRPGALEGRWALDETGGTTVADSSDHGLTGTLHADPATAWNQAFNDWGTYTSGVTLTAGEHITADGPAVRTDRSFTVGAWVNASQSGTATAVSQDGRHHSGFRLGMETIDGADYWTFTLPSSGRNGETDWTRVRSALRAGHGEWVHLAATYDMTTGEATLYVNGNKEAAAVHDTPWNAHGPLVIGGAKTAGGFADGWSGDLDEIQIHQGVLNNHGISLMFHGMTA